ncbi:hypothetical protein BH24CHL8_BH24CHL8_01050 [soil metagenome]
MSPIHTLEVFSDQHLEELVVGFTVPVMITLRMPSTPTSVPGHAP